MADRTTDLGLIDNFVATHEELEATRAETTEFVADRVSVSGKSGVIVEVSGGLNAALVTMLAVESLGAERVFGLVLPSYKYTEADALTAELVAEGLGIEYESIQLLPYVHLFQELSAPEADRRDDVPAMENAIDRMRMALAYYAGNTMDRLVLGLEDRTEWLLGSATKHGVRRGDLLPIGHLYRTEVERLAEHVGIPDGVYDFESDDGHRPPAEIHLDQATIDAILHHLVDGDMGISATVDELGVEREVVATVANRHANSRHKRELPPTPQSDDTDWYDRFHEVEMQFD